jgi:hypothetical protein
VEQATGGAGLVQLPASLLEGEVRLPDVPDPHLLSVPEGRDLGVATVTLPVPLPEEEGDGRAERMERWIGHGPMLARAG